MPKAQPQWPVGTAQPAGSRPADALFDLGVKALASKGSDSGAQAHQFFTRALSEYGPVSAQNRNKVLDLLLGISRAFMRHSEYGRAVEYAEKAAALMEAEPATDPLVLARLYIEMAAARLGMKQSDAARALCKRAFAAAGKGGREASLPLAATYLHAGMVWASFHEDRQALEYYQQSLARIEPLQAQRPGLLVRVLAKMAASHLALQDDKRARALLERSVSVGEAAQQALGGDSDWLADALDDLAGLDDDANQYERASALYEKSLKLLDARSDSDPRDVARILVRLGFAYRQTGQAATAEARLLRALRICETQQPPVPLRVAYILGSLSEVYLHMNRLKDAETALLRARELTVKLDRSTYNESGGYLQTLARLGGLYSRTAREDSARQVLKEVVEQRKALLGADHPKVAEDLEKLASAYRRLPRVALSLLTEAQQRLERAGASHALKLADVFIQLGQCLSSMEESSRAEEAFRRALAIRESHKEVPPEDVAAALCELAELYTHTRNYEKAEPIYERAIAIYDSSSAAGDQLGVSRSMSALSGLAQVYQATNRFAKAEVLFERNLAGLEKMFGQDGRQLGYALTHAADFYREVNLYPQARRYYQRALDIYRKVFPPDSLIIAEALHNLAVARADLGQKAEIEATIALLSQARQIHEKLGGPDNIETCSTLDSLASNYGRLGRTAEAVALGEKVLQIRRRLLGEQDLRTAAAKNNLGAWYLSLGQYDKAGKYLREALDTKRALGASYVDLRPTMHNLTQIYLIRHQVKQALPLLRQLALADEQRLRELRRIGTADRLERFLRQVSVVNDRIFEALAQQPRDPELLALAFRTATLHKGRLLDELRSNLQSREKATPQMQASLRQLEGLHSQIAQLDLGDGSKGPQAQERRLHLSQEAEQVELSLNRALGGEEDSVFALSERQLAERLSKALPADAALVEFVYYYGHNQDPPKEGSEESHSFYVLALILLPDGTLLAHPFGRSEPIDRLTSTFQGALETIAKTRELPVKTESDKQMLADQLELRELDLTASLRELNSLVLAPLVPLLGGRTNLMLSLDGSLHLVPFAAFLEHGKPLLARYRIAYLSSGRDLLRAPARAPSQTVAVLANPDFNTPGSQAATQESPSKSSLVRSMRELPRLKGTEKEAQQLACLMPKARVWKQAEATEATLRGLAAPGILHLATHALFLPEHIGATPLSGALLILAGASHFGQSTDTTTDGVATALELSNLNLRGTQLVVLSACNSGSGEWRVGQDVFGLRRPFMLAGAENVVVSLWQVGDESGRLLMDRYYRYLLAGWGRVEALRQAELSFYHQGRPIFEWASFIALGQDRPLVGAAGAAIPAIPAHPGEPVATRCRGN